MTALQAIRVGVFLGLWAPILGSWRLVGKRK
jgi:hypothetical protein